jgi:hypothetical protein
MSVAIRKSLVILLADCKLSHTRRNHLHPSGIQKMKKAFWLGALAYLVPTFPLGYVWHLVTFHAAYARLHLYRADVIIPFGLGSMLIQAVIFAWAYPRLFSTRREDWAASALRFFAVFTMLAWSFTTLPVAAKYQMSSVADFLKLETAFTVLQFAIVAPLFAWAYRGAPSPSAMALPLGERSRAS